MKQWVIMVGRDGWAVEVCTVPMWVRALDRSLEWALVVPFRHRLCCDIPEWTYRVPVGRRDADPDADGFNFNSLGARLWRVSTWPGTLSHRRKRGRVSIPVDVGTAQRIAPEFVAEYEEMMSEPT